MLRRGLRRAFITARDRTLVTLLKTPEPVLRRMLGPPITLEGRTLDTHAQAFCFLVETCAPSVADLPVPKGRQQMDESAPAIGGPARSVRATRDFDLGEGVRARLYVPKDAGERTPLIVYFHGGGFVTGSITSHDKVTRFLADEARARVLSVEYRLAPEHPFPAAVHDCFRAYRWARDNREILGATEAIAVAGDSAGGNLSAVVCLLARDERVARPALQLLLYPVTDCTRSTPSNKIFGQGFFLDEKSMDFYLDHYQPERRDPLASPIFAKDLGGLAPAVVITAGFDPLVDEGDAYAKRLAEAGVDTTHARHDGLIHGFANMTGALTLAHHALLAAARTAGDKLRRA